MKKDIKNSVQKVLSAVFPSADGNFLNEYGPNEIEEWDSMNHLNMIMALSNEFEITFEFEEVMAIEKISDIFLMLEKKGIK